jgi:hypothetical protein
MRRKWMWIGALAIVGMLVGYWLFIGFKSPVDDFVNTQDNGTNEDGTDADTGEGDGTLPPELPPGTPVEPPIIPTPPVAPPVKYVGYVTFYIIMDLTSTDGNGVPMHPMTGNITSFTPTVGKYVDMSTGKVYQSTPLLKGHSGAELVWGTYWIYITVIGPGGFMSYWESTHGPVIYHDSGDPQITEMFSGRCLFGENGQYRAIGQLYATYTPTGETFVLDSWTVSIEVSV